MFCQNCGKALEQDAKFCPNCGKPVIQPSQSENVAAQPGLGSAPTSEAGPAYVASNQTVVPPQENTVQHVYAQPVESGTVPQIDPAAPAVNAQENPVYAANGQMVNPPAKNRRFVPIIVSAVLLLVLAAFLVILIHSSSEPQLDNLSPYADRNRSEVVGNDLYFLDNNANLARRNLSTGETEQLINTQHIYSIFRYGNEIYFTATKEGTDNLSSDGSYLFKTDLKGDDIQQVGETNVSWFVIHEGRVYYQEEFYGTSDVKENELYLRSMDLEGSDRTLIVDAPCKNIVIVQDAIYYIDIGDDRDNVVYSIDLAGEDKFFLLQLGEDFKGTFVIYDDILYYAMDTEDEDLLCTYALESGKRDELMAGKLGFGFTVTDEYVYYADDKYNIGRFYLDNLRTEMLGLTGYGDGFRVFDDVIVNNGIFSESSYLDFGQEDREQQYLDYYASSGSVIGGDADYLYINTSAHILQVAVETWESTVVFEKDASNIYTNAFYDGCVYLLEVDSAGSVSVNTMIQIDRDGNETVLFSADAGTHRRANFYVAAPGEFLDEAVFLIVYEDETVDEIGIIAINFYGEMVDGWTYGGIEINSIEHVAGKKVAARHYTTVDGTRRYIISVFNDQTGMAEFFYDRNNDDNTRIFSIGNVIDQGDHLSFYFNDNLGLGYADDGVTIDKYLLEDANIGSVVYGKSHIYYTNDKSGYLYRIDYDGENQELLVESKTQMLELVDEKIFFYDRYENQSCYYYDTQTDEVHEAFDLEVLEFGGDETDSGDEDGDEE